MAKTIKLKHEGKTYTLEFTRATVEDMERDGFTRSDLVNKPMLTIPYVFACAFAANHPDLKREDIDHIWEKLKAKDGIFNRLAEMYAEPYEALMHEPEDGEKGNASWEASW